ncbi:MAG TPA: 2-C-methyl-D-erythritol 2,4-cyclodiphosphate synthase [Chloroflexota bacterium]|nr:2-C-methyl-D-erythritol 2,4-cyclodiphosphate synthase [Chloroflexota bacterium]
MATLRVGIGYDIHRLEVGRQLVLGGVRIPWTAGLAGHSDADVVIHALMDAMLGAACLGDIGTHFPNTDERYRDASSLHLLAAVRDLLTRQGLILSNADVMVVAEKPELAPHIESMRQRIAATLDVDGVCISIKATTNEGVGPEGRCEAISARAVVLLESLS